MNNGEEGKLTKSEKLVHSYNGLCEWSSAMEQLHSGQLYNSEHGIHVGEKLRKKPTMQYTQNLVLNLEKFLKTFWNGLDCLTNSQTSYLPGYQSSLLLTCTELKNN